MPAWTRNLRQTATYWAPGDPDGFGGVTHDPPVQILCRWQDGVRLIRTGDGEEITTDAIVYPDQELENKGYLYLGFSGQTDPLRVQGVCQVVKTQKSPHLLSPDLVLHKTWVMARTVDRPLASFDSDVYSFDDDQTSWDEEAA